MAISKMKAANIYKFLKENKTSYAHYVESLSFFSKSDTSDYFNIYAVHRNVGTILNRIRIYGSAADHLDSARSSLEQHMQVYQAQ